MRSPIALAGSLLMFVISLAAGQGPRAGEPGGELLYTTYCIACHTTQVHWRENKLVKDWGSLRFQVRRWLGNAGLASRDDDVDAVSGYLNGLYYHFPAADAKQSRAAGVIHAARRN